MISKTIEKKEGADKIHTNWNETERFHLGQLDFNLVIFDKNGIF